MACSVGWMDGIRLSPVDPQVMAGAALSGQPPPDRRPLPPWAHRRRL